MMIPSVPAPQDAERLSLMGRLRHRVAMHVPVSPFNATSSMPAVSFTFDDVPVSAGTEGAALMEEHGARATYYVAGSMLGTQADHWRVLDADMVVDLHARGHEIACHSHSHERADLITGATIEADILRNHALLKGIEPSLPLANFAYPFGIGTMTWKRRLKQYFRSSRSVRPLLNHGRMDAQYLHALPLTDRQMDAGGIERAYEEAARKNAWVIFYSHDVRERPSDYGCSPGLLRQALRAAQRLGIRIETVNDAMTRISRRIGSHVWLLAIPLV